MLSQMSLSGFMPPWQRPRPAISTPTPHELKWINLELAQPLLWDNTLGEDPSRAEVGRVVEWEVKGTGLGGGRERVYLVRPWSQGLQLRHRG